MAFWGGVDGGVGWSYFTGTVGKVEWDAYLSYLGSLAAVQRKGLCLTLISRRSESPSAAMRQQLGTFMKEHEELLSRVPANAMIFDSALARGTLTAVNWVFRKPFPERVFADVDPGFDWLASMDPNVDVGALRLGIISTVPPGQLYL